MGTFIGHAVPGSFFILYGIWWAVRILQRWGNAGHTKGARFRSTAMYSLPIGRWQLDFEGLVAIVAATIGILIEIPIAGPARGLPVHMHNIQHAIMYFFFGMFGLVALLQPVLRSRVPNVDQLHYILLAMCLTVEGLLFQFHLYGRNEIDVLVHTLLLYTIYAGAAVTLLEMKVRTSAMCALSRAFMLILQGGWFWAAGFILYNPFTHSRQWDSDDHHQLMLVVILFATLVAAVTVAMVLIAVTVAAFCGGRRDNIEYDLESPASNGYSHLLSEQIDDESI